jgi:hypothetical protein
MRAYLRGSREGMITERDLKSIGIAKKNFEQFADVEGEEWINHIETCNAKAIDDLIDMIGEGEFNKYIGSSKTEYEKRRLKNAESYMTANYLYKAELTYLFSIFEYESIADISARRSKVNTQCAKMYMGAESELIKLGYDV